MKISELLHKRILVTEKKNNYGSEEVIKEIKIMEIAPSQNWVKIQNDNGNKYWVHYSSIKPIEVLESIDKDKPK